MLEFLRRILELFRSTRPEAIATAEPVAYAAPGPEPDRWDDVDPQMRLDAAEELEAEQSRNEQFVRVQPAGLSNRVASRTRHLTPDGYYTEESAAYLLTSDKRLVRVEQLLEGGLCESCGGFTTGDHLHYCVVCGARLCDLHAYPVDGVRLCLRHAHELLYNMDMWRGPSDP